MRNMEVGDWRLEASFQHPTSNFQQAWDDEEERMKLLPGLDSLSD